MSFVLMLLYLFLAGCVYLYDCAKIGRENHVYKEKVRATYRTYNGQISSNFLAMKRDYVGEFEYANKLYNKLLDEFKQQHPIGSCYDYVDWDRGSQTMYLANEMDQRKALDLEYRFSQYGDNGLRVYCLWEARKDAVRRGFAPDNVEKTIFPGYDVTKTCFSSRLNSKNHFEKIPGYDSSFLLCSGVANKYLLGGLHGTTQDIFFDMSPSDDEYRPLYNQVKTYLEKEQLKQNAIMRHRYGI